MRAQGRWKLLRQVATWQPRVAPLVPHSLHLRLRPRRTSAGNPSSRPSASCTCHATQHQQSMPYKPGSLCLPIVTGSSQGIYDDTIGIWNLRKIPTAEVQTQGVTHVSTSTRLSLSCKEMSIQTHRSELSSCLSPSGTTLHCSARLFAEQWEEA